MRYDIDGTLITNVANGFRNYLTEIQTNLIKTSINSDGTPFNDGIGWKFGYRLNSSGVETVDNTVDAAERQSITGYIPASKGDVFLFTGFMVSKSYATHTFGYDANFNVLSEIVESESGENLVSATVTDDSCVYIRTSAIFGEGAIIEKQGASTSGDTYTLAEMPGAINQVYSKGLADGKASVEFKTQAKTVTPTSAQQTVSPDSGYDGLSEVTVNAVPTETKSVTANGTYTPSSGKFFSSVSVNVPASGITPSGSLDITENGVFDVTNFAQAIVNVASGGGSDAVMGEITATAVQKLTIDTGKTDARYFLLYADVSSLSSSLVYMFLITPMISAAFRYSSSGASTTVFTPTTASAVEGSLVNGVATCDMKSTYPFGARTYKWIAW